MAILNRLPSQYTHPSHPHQLPASKSYSLSCTVIKFNFFFAFSVFSYIIFLFDHATCDNC